MNSSALERILVRGISLLLAVALGPSLLPGMGPIPVAHAATFTVNSTGDEPDLNPGDGLCAVDEVDFLCTLRAAIQEANASLGADVIDFDVIGSILVAIQPGSALPTITDPVTIDGTTEQLHRVRLDGLNAGAGADGLRITAGNSTVKGLEIIRFSGHGIALTTNGVNTIQGSYIGVTFTNIINMGNGGDGILISDIANNAVGGTVAGTRNVISGNKNHGIEISGTLATVNTVQGNFIGSDTHGTAALRNSGNGVFINGAPNNTIGGSAAGARNVISGNGWDGVQIKGSAATGNEVSGNFIGTDATGAAALGNEHYGLNLFHAPNNTVGGITAGAGNVISGNKGETGISVEGQDAAGNQILGNLVGLDSSGIIALGNAVFGIAIDDAPNNIIGGTTAGARNVISGNGIGVAILRSAASGNQVLGNLIGTNITGTAALGNNWHGVQIEAAPNNIIGGSDPRARNVISGNHEDGVVILRSEASGNQVLGNLIGTDVTGAAALGNSRDGVFIDRAPNNTIGGAAAGARNIISGNNLYGVEITGTAASGNLVQGNLIGTNITGTVALGNWGDGVFVSAPGNTIGGQAAGAGNVISGNGGYGVEIAWSGAAGNQVQGNLIGTDVNGAIALGNDASGVCICDSPNNAIGGTKAEARNVISGNATGVRISGSNSVGNQILGNLIGTAINGTVALGNGYGVYIADAHDNTIGGAATGAGNVISGNTYDGVAINGSQATRNLVQGNLIGTDINGINALGNSGNGISLGSDNRILHNNTIGGTASGAGNTIAANNGDGIMIASGTGHAIRHNAIFSNTGLGIDLGSNGVTPNDPGDLDFGANNRQNFPMLMAAAFGGGLTKIQGTLNSTPNTTFTLEFFSNPACDPTGYGEGKTFIGSMTTATDNNGNISFTASFGVPASGFATATATDPNDNTSEFSQCVKVTPLYLVYLPLVVK